MEDHVEAKVIQDMQLTSFLKTINHANFKLMVNRNAEKKLILSMLLCICT